MPQTSNNSSIVQSLIFSTMKKLSLFALTAAVLLACSTDEPIQQMDASNLEAYAQTNGPAIIPGKYIIVFKEDRSFSGLGSKLRGKAEGILKKYGGKASDIEFVYANSIQGFSAFLSPGLYKKIAEDIEVLYVEEDKEIKLTQRGNKGGGGTTTQPAQEIPWGIARVGGAGNGVGKTAWIIDTGIHLTHPDLTVNATKGFSAFTKGKDSGMNDGNGHGTHVAGTVAALNNSIGVVGVAAGATVVPIKVLGATGSGSTSGVIAGVDHVAARAAVGDVANMSLGGGISSALDQAVINAAAKGIKFALAAGNEATSATNSSPGRANGANIYTVSAHNISDVFASFSNFGNPPVDFCAPGVSIKSTWLAGGYNTISGTSMATPHVCGILLLGPVNTRGFVTGDKDTTPDPLASR